jgi:hypothetical protein
VVRCRGRRETVCARGSKRGASGRPGNFERARPHEGCARKKLASGIAVILKDRRTDALRGLPRGAIRETVTVE